MHSGCGRKGMERAEDCFYIFRLHTGLRRDKIAKDIEPSGSVLKNNFALYLYRTTAGGNLI